MGTTWPSGPHHEPASDGLAQQAADTEARTETLESQVDTLETHSSRAKAFLEGLRDLMGTLYEAEGSAP